jgi:uncharacterized membrane protein
VSFANPLPWWALALVVVGAALVASLAYNRRTLPPTRRAVLVGLRIATLLVLVMFLMRPVSRQPDPDARGPVVAVLVDTSRSMSIEDAAGGARRIARARELVADRILPSIGARFSTEVLGFGETVTASTPEALTASARRSDVAGALAAVRDRFRGRPVAGVVLVSDGGDTSGVDEKAAGGGPPVFTVGVGGTIAAKDREILGVTAVETILDDSRVDLTVSAVSHGFGAAPFEVRLLENGRPIDTRRAAPAADGAPVRVVFQVSPGRAPTVYTVETPAVRGDIVPENNARSVLVQPPARARRVLLVEGAPGFEHSFLKRAWAADPGIEVDSVVRKGRDEQGADTFYVQAAPSRSDSLAEGYPATRDALFRYDAIVLANVDANQLTSAELDATRAFVGARGGGLLVLGARSFVRHGLAGTPLEDVLPLELTDRGGVADELAGGGRADAVSASGGKPAHRVSLTPAGEAHPIMQLGTSADDTRKRWDAVPPLAAIAAIGGPRPGASVLAVTTTPGGTPRALVAVQRFGEGRSMAFTGEASWRWRMLMPATDRSFDTFWKQALRWLALPSSDPVQLTIPPGGAPGDALAVTVLARDPSFEPLRDVSVDVRATGPDGRVEPLHAVPARREAGQDDRLVAAFRPEHSGVYRVSADVRRGAALLGTASTSVLVGGTDLEMADPRLNRALLERLASASGGRALGEGELGTLPSLLRAAAPGAALAARRDLWHSGWSFAAILVLLGAEWMLRRSWGLR